MREGPGYKELAKERILKLFELAEKENKKNVKLSNRYVHLARKVAMKNNVRIPKKLKMRICKKCYNYLVPNKNCRIRIKSKQIIYKCLDCGNITRYGIKR